MKKIFAMVCFLVFFGVSANSLLAQDIQESIPGGLFLHETIDQEAQNVFDSGMKGIYGVVYVPLAYATQTVDGQRYIFVCISKPVTGPNPSAWEFCTISIHVNPQGKAVFEKAGPIQLEAEE